MNEQTVRFLTSYQDYDGGRAEVFGLIANKGFDVMLIGEYGDKVESHSDNLKQAVVEVYEMYFQLPFRGK
jgi:hypothetical protein